ncbi:hypothetical protein [Peribacillus frigoritolerans]
MKSEKIKMENFKDILLYAYNLGNESEDMKVSILIEEIKQQLVITNCK